jgi:hypothetical protein
MSKVYKHPISGYIYSVNVNGLVKVEDPATGRIGIFDDNGVWQDGEVLDIDLQATGWVGRTPEARALREADL